MGPASRVRVLICDDDERFRDALRSLFEREETIEVISSAANGEEAVRLALLLRPDVVTI